MDLASTHLTRRCPLLWNTDIRGSHVDGDLRGENSQSTATIKQQLKKSRQEKMACVNTIAQGLFILGHKDRTENVVFFLKPF